MNILKRLPAGRKGLSDDQAQLKARQRKFERVLKRDARWMWNPRENCVIIGCIVGGVATLHVYGVGLVPLGIGLLARHLAYRKYRPQIIARMKADQDD